jgi:hypothetical protein
MLRSLRIRPWQVFPLVFLLLLALYWPARKGGWVSDTLGWLDAVRHQSFGDFVNRSGFKVRSLYQTTQLATWSFYQLFGANRIAWHLLHIALQALNATLLFAFFRRLLSDARLERAAGIALAAVLLFSLSPSLSEVIVWEAAFHYLQGLAFILAQLLLLQAFLHKPRARLAFAAAVIYAVASFSLELFYLSPAFSLSLLLYYRLGKPAVSPDLVRRAARSFFLPQLIILAAHLLLLRAFYGDSTGRLGAGLWQQPLTYYAIKPPDYLLHLFGGRFLPQAFRSAWHRFFCTYAGAGLFYAALAGSLSFIAFRFRRMSGSGQLISWSWCATLIAMALVTPMWFPERLLVSGDRYLYLMLPFFSLLLCIAIAQLARVWLRRGLPFVLICVSASGVVQLALMWEKSERITLAMQRSFSGLPAGANVLLLNAPANFRGIPMTGSGPDGEFALLRSLLYPELKRVAVMDAFAGEYSADSMPVNVERMSRGHFRVSLKNPARWWFGADYAARFRGQGYDLYLVSPLAYDVYVDTTSGSRVQLATWDGTSYRFISESALTER